ncbi:DUF3850 domain-containing protein [Dielma fastidiosa]|uniref:DUF3850 domain-containing protein n=1 Tax=Dielma fastidiosa TaxID=1034346 RepID=UPI000E49408B|nr:DUF3850 domain-containing protein [Dielma fastidiosa]RHN00864.1 DUF3850 domain-containing protein [Dielma fastidiosa]
MKTHEIKCYPEYYQEIINGAKRFEIRFNDRNYKVNDILVIRENTLMGLTGRYCICCIVYILDNPTYLQPGYVCLSIMLLNMYER